MTHLTRLFAPLLRQHFVRPLSCPGATSFAACLTRSNSTDAPHLDAAPDVRLSLQLARLLHFQLTRAQAEQAFDAWHKQRFLSPNRLLEGATGPIRQAYLPFWTFDACMQVHTTGILGRAVEGSSMEWEQAEWKDRGRQEYASTLPIMQVYASYRHRRDLIEVLKIPGLSEAGRPLTQQEARQQEVSSTANSQPISLDAPAMRQSIAWQFAVMGMKRAEAAAAEALLKSETGCQSVRDVQIRLKTLRRRSRLVFVPAFSVDYNYGEHFNVHGHRQPEQFQAVISGVTGAVAAERHFSPQKVQVAAAAAMGAAGTAVAGINLYGHTLFSPASLLAALLVCTTAGLAARLSPLLLRQHEEDQRIQVEDAEMERIMSQGLGPQDMLDEKHEEIRTHAEWRRWSEANKWSWSGEKRLKWAEALWRRQQERRLQRHAFEKNRAKAEARLKYEQETEARRRARWGHSSHHWQSAENAYSGAQSGGGRRDFLGYYALLGLEGDLGSAIPTADIKKAFREAALRWHPDVLHVDDASEKARAHERFAKVKKAYEVLRNPAKRRDYDSGIRDPG